MPRGKPPAMPSPRQGRKPRAHLGSLIPWGLPSLRPRLRGSPAGSPRSALPLRRNTADLGPWGSPRLQTCLLLTRLPPLWRRHRLQHQRPPRRLQHARLQHRGPPHQLQHQRPPRQTCLLLTRLRLLWRRHWQQQARPPRRPQPEAAAQAAAPTAAVPGAAPNGRRAGCRLRPGGSKLLSSRLGSLPPSGITRTEDAPANSFAPTRKQQAPRQRQAKQATTQHGQ